MKKIFMLFAVTIFSMPVLAVCSIDGDACTADLPQTPTLMEKYLPNHLENLQKTDAFAPKYRQPYYDELIYTETGSATTPEADYNSNCQFGVCLPGTTPEEGEMFR